MLLDLHWRGWTRNDTIDSHAYQILTITAPYDDGGFTVRADVSAEREWRFGQMRLAMHDDGPSTVK